LLEIAAIVLLLVFWPAGVVLLWMSDLWTRRDKLIGTLVPPGGFAGVFIFGLPALLLGAHASSGPACMAEAGSDASGNVVITPTTCTGPLESVLHIALSVLLVVLLILVLISPILTAAYLGYRLRRRVGTGPIAPVSAPPASRGLEIAAVLLTALFWPLGLVLVATSAAWTTTQKVAGGLLAVSGTAGFILLGIFSSSSGVMMIRHWYVVGWPLVFGMQLVAAAFLGSRLHLMAPPSDRVGETTGVPSV
jgi:hypothetical protein